jgi:hypothetical protein
MTGCHRKWVIFEQERVPKIQRKKNIVLYVQGKALGQGHYHIGGTWSLFWQCPYPRALPTIKILSQIEKQIPPEKIPLTMEEPSFENKILLQ